jgi:hypothetical protein
MEDAADSCWATSVHCCRICPTITENGTQVNAVFSPQKEMDRVGFEPTISAQELAFLIDPLV